MYTQHDHYMYMYMHVACMLPLHSVYVKMKVSLTWSKWVFWCLERSEELENDFWHCGYWQTYGFSPVCVLRWIFKFSSRENALSHPGYWRKEIWKPYTLFSNQFALPVVVLLTLFNYVVQYVYTCHLKFISWHKLIFKSFTNTYSFINTCKTTFAHVHLLILNTSTRILYTQFTHTHTLMYLLNLHTHFVHIHLHNSTDKI